MSSNSVVTLNSTDYVWRYLTMEKLLALLTSESLHFTRLDKFQDPWEGTLPTRRRARLEEIDRRVSENFRQYSSSLRNETRKLYFLNCWHISEHESAALWAQYASSGLAIRSTVGRLQAATHEEADLTIKRVNYVEFASYDNNKPDKLEHVCLKRPSFSHEQELRIIYYDAETARRDLGILPQLHEPRQSYDLKVNVTGLIESIWLSPLAEEWVLKVLRRVVELLHLPSIQVERSTLYDPTVL